MVRDVDCMGVRFDSGLMLTWGSVKYQQVNERVWVLIKFFDICLCDLQMALNVP